MEVPIWRLQSYSSKLEHQVREEGVNLHDKNINLDFSYHDELLEKHEDPKPRKAIGFKPAGKNED